MATIPRHRNTSCDLSAWTTIPRELTTALANKARTATKHKMPSVEPEEKTRTSACAERTTSRGYVASVVSAGLVHARVVFIVSVCVHA